MVFTRGSSTLRHVVMRLVPTVVVVFHIGAVIAEADYSKVGTFSSRPGVQHLDSYRGPTRHTAKLPWYVNPFRESFNDVFWPRQWYAHDFRVKDGPQMDLNLLAVYLMGITGKGVNVAIIDSDFEANHKDLSPNFLSHLSHDMCLNKPGLPSEVRPKKTSNGMLSAGVIAMVANNTACGVGVAFNSKIAGIVDDCPDLHFIKKAFRFIVNLEDIDIYSYTRSEADSEFHGLTDRAIEIGVKTGRKRKGAMYVFAADSGRDHLKRDFCGFNPLLNHRGSIPIGGANQRGQPTSFGSRCASIFATAYSGDQGTDQVFSTDSNNECKPSSAPLAAPFAVGIIALVLEANPELRYRDVMHIVTMGAEVAPLADNRGTWQRNGAGFWVSNDFGFGLLNAENMVLLAQDWERVLEERTCEIGLVFEEGEEFVTGVVQVLQFETDACEGTKDAVHYLEQVQVSFTITYPSRGAVALNLTSPEGTETVLVEAGPWDAAGSPFTGQRIKSVHYWGENPQGTWKLAVLAKSAPDGGPATARGHTRGFTLTLRGTAEPPPHHHLLPRTYTGFRLPDGQTSQDVFNKD